MVFKRCSRLRVSCEKMASNEWPVLNATFNNTLVISWRSVLLVEETGGPGEDHRPVASHWQTLSHNVVSSTPRHERGSNSHLIRGHCRFTIRFAGLYFRYIIVILHVPFPSTPNACQPLFEINKYIINVYKCITRAKIAFDIFQYIVNVSYVN
jgi:hypothetical protein